MKHLSLFIFSLFQLACNNHSLQTNTTGSIPYGSNEAAAQRINIDDVTIYLETYGKGEPLILLHGNSGSIENFDKHIPELSKHFKVIAIDSRLQGRSSYSDKELTYQLMAQDVSALMDSLKIDSAYFMGWSDGANITLELALMAPQKIRKGILMDANYLVKDAFVPNDSSFRMSVNDPLVLSSKSFIERYFGSLPRLTPDTTKLEKIHTQLSNLMNNYPKITEEQLHTIQVPLLVLAADNDIFTIDHTVSLYKNLPKANLCIVHSASHLNAVEFPDLVRSEILRYLNTTYRKIDPWYFFK